MSPLRSQTCLSSPKRPGYLNRWFWLRSGSKVGATGRLYSWHGRTQTLRLVDHHRDRLQPADAHLRRSGRETEDGCGRPHAPVQRKAAPSKALVKGLARELGISESYLDKLAKEVRKDLGAK
jgi:hypothetical protein